jgi:hypothetical protein
VNEPYDRPFRGSRCQCCACLEYFNSTHAFDRHRVGRHVPIDQALHRRCLTVMELRCAGWACDPRGFWRTPRDGAGAPPINAISQSTPAEAA